MEWLDRNLTSEGCNAMAKTSGKACVLSIRIQLHIVFLYIIIIVPTFYVTPSPVTFMWWGPTLAVTRKATEHHI